MTQIAASKLPHILVVDDDERLRDLLQQYLIDHQFFVSTADSAASARQMRQFFSFDAIILDVMMPEETGLQFVASLPRPRPPVLMLTALSEPEDRVRGFESGADDYLVKPFDPRELLIRLRKLVQPQHAAQPATTPVRTSAIVRFGAFRFDPDTLRLHRDGEPVHLTSAEAQCLRVLARQAGKPVPRDALAELAGMQEKQNERSMDVLINRLRKKIEPTAGRPVYIQTVRGEGYMLSADR